MRKGVEFWLRVAITLALVLLVIAAPSVLLPFIVLPDCCSYFCTLRFRIPGIH